MKIFDSILKNTTQISKEMAESTRAEPNQTRYVVKYKSERPIYKPVKYEKCTIILVENTDEVFKQKDKLEKIVKGIITTGFIVVVSYGSTVKQSDKFTSKAFDCENIFNCIDINGKTCMYDALKTITEIVEDEKFKKFKIAETDYKITDIEIIGIGTCSDNCSTIPRGFAVNLFNRVIKKHNIATKYFCLTEESFVEAASIGFHSIGAICRDYIRK